MWIVWGLRFAAKNKLEYHPKSADALVAYNILLWTVIDWMDRRHVTVYLAIHKSIETENRNEVIRVDIIDAIKIIQKYLSVAAF